MFLGCSVVVLLIVPLGPKARPRLCVLASEDFADCAVLVESIEGARSTVSETVDLRPRTVLALLVFAALLPATIFNAQLANDVDDDLRADASVACSWLLSRRKAGTAPVGGTNRSLARAFRGGFAPLDARDRVCPIVSASLSTLLATEGARLLFLLVPVQMKFFQFCLLGVSDTTELMDMTYACGAELPVSMPRASGCSASSSSMALASLSSMGSSGCNPVAALSPLVRVLVRPLPWSLLFSSSRSRFSMSMLETSHSCSIFLNMRSRSSALRRRAVICASRWARSPASCLTRATAPVCRSASCMLSSLAKCRFPGTLADSVGVSSKRAERSLVADEAATRLPTICCVDLVTFLTVDTGVVLLLRSGGGTALTVSGDATVLLSAVLTLSSGCGVERNQPFTRDCAGDVSGLGDSEGNEVRLLVSTSGEGARLRLRLRDVLEERFEGRMRCMLRFRGLDMVELCEAVRTRSTARGGSIAAMFVESDYKHAHSCSRRRNCVGANMVRRRAVIEMCLCVYVMRGGRLFSRAWVRMQVEALRHMARRSLLVVLVAPRFFVCVSSCKKTLKNATSSGADKAHGGYYKL